MNKEEIKHFKAMLRQGSLRHMNILLDDKFQKELLNIIKDYEKLQQENEKLNHYKLLYQKVKDRNDKAIEILQMGINAYNGRGSRTALFECINDSKNILRGNNEE